MEDVGRGPRQCLAMSRHFDADERDDRGRGAGRSYRSRRGPSRGVFGTARFPGFHQEPWNESGHVGYSRASTTVRFAAALRASADVAVRPTLFPPFGRNVRTRVRLAPAAHPAFGGTVGLRGLRPACWTPSTTARKCSVSVTSVGVLRRSRASGPGSSVSRIRSSILFGWRRRESNPGPQGVPSAFVHVRSRITQPAGFLDSART
jgi:hypothetical protein